MYNTYVHIYCMCRVQPTADEKKARKSPLYLTSLLNQAHAWFNKIVSVQTSVCVCPPPRLLITSGVMWHDMDSI